MCSFESIVAPRYGGDMQTNGRRDLDVLSAIKIIKLLTYNHWVKCTKLIYFFGFLKKLINSVEVRKIKVWQSNSLLSYSFLEKKANPSSASRCVQNETF